MKQHMMRQGSTVYQCVKCGKVIKPGDVFYTSAGSRGRGKTKRYCAACNERMYQ